MTQNLRLALVLLSVVLWALIASSLHSASHVLAQTTPTPSTPPSATQSTPASDPALRGHGGPIRSIAVLDEKTVVTGGFDAAIIVWEVTSGTATRVLRYHDSSINSLSQLTPQCFASGGEDGRVALWCDGAKPHAVAKAHEAAVTASSVAIDRNWLATASWDRTVLLWLLTPQPPGGLIMPRFHLSEHLAPVNGIAFGGDNQSVISSSYDGEVRVTSFDPTFTKRPWLTAKRQLPAALNGLVVLPDNRIALASVDGRVRVLNPDLTPSFEIELPEGPLMAIVASPDGRMIATAGMRTPVALIDVEQRAVARRIHGPGLPIWALAFSLDGTELFTGGADRALRRFKVATGEPVGAPIAKPADSSGPLSNEPGAIVFRACTVCHTLRPEEGHRAGPTLHGIMGRRIATAPGYDYSDALKKMDIVWTPETIARLFEVGPTVYTPGTKMPEQRVTNPDDRRALVEWLAKVTKP